MTDEAKGTRKRPPARETRYGEMVSVNWLIPVDLWDRLYAAAEDDDRSIASLARRILIDWAKANT